MSDRTVGKHQHCADCRYWSEDDDGDGRGCCALLLNELYVEGWRTKPTDGCTDFRPAEETACHE